MHTPLWYPIECSVCIHMERKPQFACLCLRFCPIRLGAIRGTLAAWRAMSNQQEESGSIGRHSCTISKTRASVSSGYPNTEKQMKARGRRPSAFIVSRCLDIPMKHEARVLEITSHDHSQTNHKQRLSIRIVCYLTFLHG